MFLKRFLDNEPTPSATPPISDPLKVSASPNPPPGATSPPVIPPPAAAAPAASDTWLTGLPSELKGYVENKGFKDPGAMVDAYRNLEKHLGVPKERLLKLPEKDEDPGWSEIHNRLGRPDKPEGYEFAPPPGGDPETTAWAAKTFHELGLSKRQAQSLITKWNDQQKGTLEKQAGDKTVKQDLERTELRREWGAALEQNVKLVNAAAQEFGLDEAAVQKLGDTLGIKATMKLLHAIGERVGEDKFVSGNNAQGGFGPLSPDAAKDKIKTLMTDKDFVKRYRAGDVQARDQMAKLHEYGFGQEH